MSNSATCPRCHEQILPGDRFCTQCGTEVLAAQGDAATARISTDRMRREARSDNLLDAIRKATLGDYEILRQIGSGGMARVFLAHDIALDRKVAVKVLLPGLATTPGTVERFKREARTAASLSHPHIIPIYVVRETHDLLYFVMQFVEGRPLDGIVGDIGKLPIDVAIAVLSQVSGALHFAHRQGVIHRDVKPGNILIDNEGWAVVTDFGIAKVREAVGLTLTGSTIGTPAYMSPEQCSGEPVTGASDQYSLGVVGFEMLTGRPPFSEGTVTDIMRAHVEREPPVLSDLRPDCPPRIASVLARMLAKSPGDRYPSLGAVAAALGAPPVTGEGGVRTAMREIARSGAHPSPLPVTPSSPVPLAKARRSTTEVVPAIDDAAGPPPQRERKRYVPLAAVAAVLVATLAIWAATRPDDRVTTPQTAPDPPAQSAPVVPLSIMAPESLVVGQADRFRTLGGAARSNEPVRWETSTPDLLRVDADGGIEAVAPGVARVIAYLGADTASYQLRIVSQPNPTTVASTPPAQPPPAPPVVTAVAIVPDRPQLEIGQSVTLTLLARDARGAQLVPDRVEWASSDPVIAEVSSSGVVTARAPGTGRIHVTADGVEGTANVTVTPVPVATVEVNRSVLQLTVGETATVSADPQSAAGRSLENRRAEWRSTNPSVATVSPSGVVTARGPGSTRIEVGIEGATAFTQVTVSAAADPDPPPPPEDPEPIIRTVVDQYANAIQAENLAALLAIYPGLPDREADTWRTFFDAVTDLQVETEVLDVAVSGSRGTVRVRQVLVFRSTRWDRQESEFVATMERDSDRWYIARIN